MKRKWNAAKEPSILIMDEMGYALCAVRNKDGAALTWNADMRCWQRDGEEEPIRGISKRTYRRMVDGPLLSQPGDSVEVAVILLPI